MKLFRRTKQGIGKGILVTNKRVVNILHGPNKKYTFLNVQFIKLRNIMQYENFGVSVI